MVVYIGGQALSLSLSHTHTHTFSYVQPKPLSLLDFLYHFPLHVSACCAPPSYYRLAPCIVYRISAAHHLINCCTQVELEMFSVSWLQTGFWYPRTSIIPTLSLPTNILLMLYYMSRYMDAFPEDTRRVCWTIFLYERVMFGVNNKPAV